jgi:PAS domain S-box-containing protein
MNISDRIFSSVTSFRSKQQLIIMLACLIVLSISLVSSMIFETISFKRDSRTRLEVLADIIAADISAALAFGDTNAIAKSLQTLAVDQSITQLFVLNAQGEIAGWYIRGNRQQMPVDVKLRLKHLHQEGPQSLIDLTPEVNRSITYDGEYLGNILVELDSRVVIGKLLVTGGIGSVILLLSALGSYLLAKRLGRIVTDPVQSLAATMEEVTRTKNYHVRADVHGLTELSLLSMGFNEMLGEIALRDEAILESECRWKFALEGAGDGVWDWNIQTDAATYSKRWKEMLGYSSDDNLPTSREWVDRIHPDDQEYVAEAMQTYLDGNSDTYVIEFRLRCKNDSYMWILDRGMVVSRGEDGRPLRMIGTHTEITERKRVEEELRKRNIEIEQFLYAVSHDLRTPLVTVKTFLGFLEKDMAVGSQKKITQDLQYIHGATNKMKLLLDELLNLSRIDRVETPHARVPFRGLLAEVLDVMAGVINERKVTVCLNDTTLDLFGDRSRLSMIWQNLIENAIKYTDEDSIPHIELGFAHVDGETVFFVKDRGIGIDPQYCSKIFGLFEKLDSTSSGAGLGLTMVQRIVEKCSGRIWVESEGIGTGSCFYFTLPDAMLKSDDCDCKAIGMA